MLKFVKKLFAPKNDLSVTVTCRAATEDEIDVIERLIESRSNLKQRIAFKTEQDDEESYVFLDGGEFPYFAK